MAQLAWPTIKCKSLKIDSSQNKKMYPQFKISKKSRLFYNSFWRDQRSKVTSWHLKRKKMYDRITPVTSTPFEKPYDGNRTEGPNTACENNHKRYLRLRHWELKNTGFGESRTIPNMGREYLSKGGGSIQFWNHTIGESHIGEAK